MARAQITQEKIIEMNELYLQIKTYAGVSRAMGGSPSPTTVKKYIIEEYVPQAKLQVKKFDKELPEVPLELFKGVENWGELCILSEEEKEEIRELWDELSL